MRMSKTYDATLLLVPFEYCNLHESFFLLNLKVLLLETPHICFHIASKPARATASCLQATGLSPLPLIGFLLDTRWAHAAGKILPQFVLESAQFVS